MCKKNYIVGRYTGYSYHEFKKVIATDMTLATKVYEKIMNCDYSHAIVFGYIDKDDNTMLMTDWLPQSRITLNITEMTNPNMEIIDLSEDELKEIRLSYVDRYHPIDDRPKIVKQTLDEAVSKKLSNMDDEIAEAKADYENSLNK